MFTLIRLSLLRIPHSYLSLCMHTTHTRTHTHTQTHTRTHTHVFEQVHQLISERAALDYVFSYHRMCSLTIECVLLLGASIDFRARGARLWPQGLPCQSVEGSPYSRTCSLLIDVLCPSVQGSSYSRMCSLLIECVLCPSVKGSSYSRTCSLPIDCVLFL